ncbi:protein Abitram isoform X2 [Dioscorea cayenensis subsp. rotundata]|uniref:Protein Abitram isoform X2 n=1 Tax=Dioscorea cayennensis subsp. rotundata TaxID=55577 RepID=A0AB40AN44_DIOCR|nr:protein Abitram isoform X2 [Dioscorea cayenensis subsp. rotundata]
MEMPKAELSTPSSSSSSSSSSASLQNTKEDETLKTVPFPSAGDRAPNHEDDLRSFLLPEAHHLPVTPPSAIEANFTCYFALDFLKPGHDQYIYRHANGLCVIGLAPTHVALKEEGGVVRVDFNVGKSDRSEMKVTGKRKRNAKHFESNTALCKVFTNGNFFLARCCVKGSLLEVNDRLIKQPDLLNTSADREGYLAIIMPKPADWLKIKDSLLNYEDYKKLRGII